MAHLIEPCCSHKHLSELRNKLGKDGTEEFEGYGDLSLTELLPPLVNHYNGVRLLIAAPAIPDQAADVIKACMRKEWTLVDGSGRIPAVTRLTLVADLSREKSPKASQWLRDNRPGCRMTLVDNPEQEDTVILLPDLAITGPVNLRYGRRFTATATTNPEAVAALWKQYDPELSPAEAKAEADEPEPEKPKATPKKKPKPEPEAKD